MHLPGSRRPSLVALLALASAPLAAPAAASAAAPSVPAGSAKVSRGVCSTSATDADERAASFTVRARALPSTVSYGFSVRLQERAPGAGWRTLRGSDVPTGFGSFVTARSGAPMLSRRLNVQGLHPGSAYRLRASFRWSTETGARTAVRTSRSCSVKDLRPDVGLSGEFGWQPSTAGGEVAYRIGLKADGLDLLRGVDVPVVVRQGQTVLATGVVRPSAAAETLLLPGRRCTKDVPVIVQLDPDGVLQDRIDEDDVLTAACAPVER